MASRCCDKHPPALTPVCPCRSSFHGRRSGESGGLVSWELLLKVLPPPGPEFSIRQLKTAKLKTENWVVDKQIEWQFTLNLGMVKRNQGVHTLAASGLLQFAVKLMDMSLSRRQLQLFRRETNRNHFISSAPSISAKIPTLKHLAIKWLRLQRRLEWGAEIYTCQSSKIREFYRKFKFMFGIYVL